MEGCDTAAQDIQQIQQIYLVGMLLHLHLVRRRGPVASLSCISSLDEPLSAH
jgi:hypothetical protein